MYAYLFNYKYDYLDKNKYDWQHCRTPGDENNRPKRPSCFTRRAGRDMRAWLQRNARLLGG